MNRADLRAALEHANLTAFLRVIREGESRQTEDAYRLENGRRVLPECPVEHPWKGQKSPPGRAFGAYQFLASTWARLVRQYGFEAMSPECQDEAAVALIAERRALDPVIAGDLDEAFRRLNTPVPMWTSLPGGTEPNAATARARETYLKWGGYLSAAPATDPLATEHYGEAVTESVINPIPSPEVQEERMALAALPLAAELGLAALPYLKDLIPALGAAFGSGSEVQKRNIAGVTAVVDVVTKATGTSNVQDAIQVMRADPAKLADARRAVDDILPMLGEAGGGGIKGAREAASAQSGDWRKLIFSLPFVAMLLFIPTIWAVVAAAVFKASWLLELDAQMRGTVIGFVMGTVAGSIVMYVYGASMTKSAPQPTQER